MGKKLYLTEEERLAAEKAVGNRADAKYYAANKESINARKRAARVLFTEEQKARRARTSAAYQSANREELTAKRDAKYLANKDEILRYRKEWHAVNPEYARVYMQNRRAKMRANGGKLPSDIIERLLLKQKGFCNYCAVDLADSGQHLDHIMPVSKGGAHEETNVQLLCPLCNRRKYNKHPDEFKKIAEKECQPNQLFIEDMQNA